MSSGFQKKPCTDMHPHEEGTYRYLKIPWECVCQIRDLQHESTEQSDGRPGLCFVFACVCYVSVWANVHASMCIGARVFEYICTCVLA